MNLVTPSLEQRFTRPAPVPSEAIEIPLSLTGGEIISPSKLTAVASACVVAVVPFAPLTQPVRLFVATAV